MATFSMEKSNFITLLRRVCSRLCSNIPPPAQAVRPTAASDAAAELERVKKAVSTLGRELSELKNKVDLAISMINKNKTGA